MPAALQFWAVIIALALFLVVVWLALCSVVARVRGRTGGGPGQTPDRRMSGRHGASGWTLRCDRGHPMYVTDEALRSERIFTCRRCGQVIVR